MQVLNEALLVLGALGTDADLPEYSLDISAGARRLLVHKAQVMLCLTRDVPDLDAMLWMDVCWCIKSITCS